MASFADLVALVVLATLFLAHLNRKLRLMIRELKKFFNQVVDLVQAVCDFWYRLGKACTPTAEKERSPRRRLHESAQVFPNLKQQNES